MANSKLHKLREKLMEELEGCCKDGPLDTAKMEAIYKLSESIKNLDKIESGEKFEGYSGRPHYSMTPRGYSYMSYDDGRKNMIHRIGDLMMCTSDERTQNILRNAIEQLEMN